MRAAEPAQAARELIFGRTKLCGLNSGADLRAARPAAFAGFVFVPGSPRHVTAQRSGAAGRSRAQVRHAAGRRVPRCAAAHASPTSPTLLNLHAVQLHGHEDVEYVRALRRELPPACEIWTALSVGREPLASRGGDRLLFDNGDGGSGRQLRLGAGRAPSRACRRRWSPAGSAPQMRAPRSALGAYAIDVGSARRRAARAASRPRRSRRCSTRCGRTSRERLRACA